MHYLNAEHHLSWNVNNNINSKQSNNSSTVEGLQVVNDVKAPVQNDYIFSIPRMPTSHKPLYVCLLQSIRNTHLEFQFTANSHIEAAVKDKPHSTISIAQTFVLVKCSMC